MILDEYNLIKSIGKGSFGEVFLTKKEKTGEEFATKKMNKSLVMEPKVKKYFNNEIYILKHVDHENIIKLYDMKQTANSFYLITEYCNGGSLNSALSDYKISHGCPFPQEVVQHFMRQIVSGLSYLHSKKILHRDLKLDNILLSFPDDESLKKKDFIKAKTKIIDFGFARYLVDDNLAKSLLGSPINMDPKILEKMRKVNNGSGNSFGYDQKADIWSLGTLCYEMLIGSPAFDAKSYEDLLSKLNKGEYKIPDKCKLSKEAISFLNCMLQYDAKQRYDIKDLENHRFLTKNVKDFTPVDLTKIDLKDSNNNIILNIKKDQGIWSLFTSQMDLTSIDEKNMIDTTKRKTTECSNLLSENDTDYFGSMTRRMENMALGNKETTNHKNNNVTNPISRPSIKTLSPILPTSKIDSDIAKKFLDNFSEINKDFIVVNPSLLPFIPGDFHISSNKFDKFTEDHY